MLKGLLSGAGLMRAGIGMMRRGKEMRANLREAPARAATLRRSQIISKVKTQTRGAVGTSKSGAHLYSKHTKTGQARRNTAAAMMRAKRAGLPVGVTHQSLVNQATAANRARTKTIVRNVKGITHSIMPKSQLSKKTAGGRFSRYQTAQFLRSARRGPVQWGNLGATYDLRRKKTP